MPMIKIKLVIPSGTMNSWFYHEFMVCSMGSISANIADNQVKIDYAVSIMVLGSGMFMAGGQIPWCARQYHCAHQLLGFLSSMLCVVSCVLARG
jgi:hypothetical protein